MTAKLDQCSRDLRRRLTPALAAARAAGHPTGITSAHRSRQRQAELYADWKAWEAYQAGRGPKVPRANRANRPGTSKHEHEDPPGTPAADAADLDFPGGRGSREHTAAVRWWHSNGHRWGLHFPIRSEDWHVESNRQPFTPPLSEEDDMKPDEREALFETRDLLRALVAPRRPDKKDTDPDAISLGDVLTDDGD